MRLLLSEETSEMEARDWSGVEHASSRARSNLATERYMASDSLESAAFIVVRSNQSMRDVDKEIRAAVSRVDADQPVFVSTTMQELIDDALADRRFAMGLLASAGFFALLMATGGVYGVTSYLTSRRTQEIGVRIALGATRRNVQVLVFGQSFFVSLIGLFSGLVLH